jgi:hypothetical protein
MKTDKNHKQKRRKYDMFCKIKIIKNNEPENDGKMMKLNENNAKSNIYMRYNENNLHFKIIMKIMIP